MTKAAIRRDDWITDEIYTYNHPFATQLPAELAAKMDKMAASAFAFYRGSAHIFYRDMIARPTTAFVNAATARTWLVGDMHLQNLGAFRDSAGRHVFGVTDFDEAYWGPWVWDIRRMAISIVLAAKANRLSASDQKNLVRRFIDAYFDKIRDFRGTNDEHSFRLTTSNTDGVVKDTLRKSAGGSRTALLAKYTSVNGGVRRFLATNELQEIPADTYAAIQSAIADGYVNSIPGAKRRTASYYQIKDIRLKLGSGVGSLGRYRYLILIEGPSPSHSDDVILVMKQQTASAVSIASTMPAHVYGHNEGCRVAKGMKAALASTDVLVGYTRMNGLDFLVREKSPYEEDFDYTLLNSYATFNEAAGYAGQVLASVHALADKDYDETLIPCSLDKEIDEVTTDAKAQFKTETVNFASNYARQVEYDWQSLLRARLAGQAFY